MELQTHQISHINFKGTKQYHLKAHKSSFVTQEANLDNEAFNQVIRLYRIIIKR